MESSTPSPTPTLGTALQQPSARDLLRLVSEGIQGDSPNFLARTDVNAFIERIVTDNRTGGPVRQGEIHKSWQRHIGRCQELERFCGILAPWGHGKTEQVAIARSLFELGKNPNLRVKIVTNTPEFAQARLQTCQKYIKESRIFRQVFPGIQPAHESDWNKHKLVVQRDTYSEDGSIEAYGVLQTATGGRADLLIFDDIVDLNNAILNPAMRPKVVEAFHNVWLPRLEPGGFAIYIATRWHLEDVTGVLLANSQWRFLVQAVSEDLSGIESQLIEHEIPEAAHALVD